jgi:hypothetical protein
MNLDVRFQPKLAMDYKCFVDGIEAKYCFFADEEEGYARCYVVDKQGRRQMVNGKPQAVILFGKVELRRIEGHE